MTEELNNVLRLRLAAKEEAPAAQRNPQRRLGRDWAQALDAVQEASDRIAAAERRANETEARGIALAERALEELKRAEARVQTAEARAAEAEARAQEAEDWLARLHDAIQERLLPRQDTARGSSAAA
ncbi:MAG TPA: hypothetical protein VHG27_01930 [Xanthobacteraceae bacterium]|nr:hypothetical protein [Xanthobacteraceae bacterium]